MMSKQQFKYLFKPYFEKIIDELDNLSKKLSSEIFKYDPIEERELQYREGAIGISELLQCPIKAELRRKYGDEIEIKSNEISDGYIFEHLIKLIATKIFGSENVIPEKVLPYEVQVDEKQTCKIDGHLDLMIKLEQENAIIGLELKSTVIQYNSKLYNRPERIIFVKPEDIKQYNINEKYILQAKIQRFILEHLYPDKYIEQYLFIKTQLKTKLKIGKTYLVIPITESITEEKLKELCYEFIYNKTPRKPYECKYCIYKQHNLCDGINIKNENQKFNLNQRDEYKYELLEQYIELKKQLKQIEEELKTLFPKFEKYKDKYPIGWVNEVVPDINILVNILRAKRLNLNNYLEVKPNAIPKLKEILKNMTPSLKRTRKRFIVPDINNFEDEIWLDESELE